MAYVETLLSSWLEVMKSAGVTLSLLLIIVGGVVYGLAQLQPGDTRGRWQSMAIGLFIGGVLIAAIIGAAEVIQSISSDLLT
ncbi:hypothetical protein H0O01_01245 [Candidatus Micrarchaeota archaeon]|nr:hypothetical protein [Candidatus Micrarchaeota archaeon]